MLKPQQNTNSEVSNKEKMDVSISIHMNIFHVLEEWVWRVPSNHIILEQPLLAEFFFISIKYPGLKSVKRMFKHV